MTLSAPSNRPMASSPPPRARPGPGPVAGDHDDPILRKVVNRGGRVKLPTGNSAPTPGIPVPRPAFIIYPPPGPLGSLVLLPLWVPRPLVIPRGRSWPVPATSRRTPMGSAGGPGMTTSVSPLGRAPTARSFPSVCGVTDVVTSTWPLRPATSACTVPRARLRALAGWLSEPLRFLESRCSGACFVGGHFGRHGTSADASGRRRVSGGPLAGPARPPSRAAAGDPGHLGLGVKTSRRLTPMDPCRGGRSACAAASSSPVDLVLLLSACLSSGSQWPGKDRHLGPNSQASLYT
jgi:hypothetical protein